MCAPQLFPKTFLDRFSSPREGQIPDRFRQVWTGFRKNLPEPVRVLYLTKPGPNLTENHPHACEAAGLDARSFSHCFPVSAISRS